MAASAHTRSNTPPTAIPWHSGIDLLPERGRGGSTADRRPEDLGRATTGRPSTLATPVTQPTVQGPHRGPRSNPQDTHPPTQPSAAGSSHTPPDHLRCISSNVQRSQSNTSLLLETHADADIICVQEIFWGSIRNVPSADCPEGIPYTNTVVHANFMCIGASAHSRVAIYVNKKWAHASPQLQQTTLSHRDIACLTLHFAAGDFTFLNVYNDSRTHEAVDFLLDRYTHLPPIAFMAGDFNLRHSMWDARELHPLTRSTRPQRRACDDLIQLSTMELGLHLLNDPEGPPTWTSNNTTLRPGVLDLVWVDPDLGQYEPIQILEHDRGLSDHAVLAWTMPIAPEQDATPRIQRDSEAAAAFIEDAARALAALPPRYASKAHVEECASDLQRALQDAWHAHSTVPRRCARSKTWWDSKCATTAKLAREQRARAAAARQERTHALHDHSVDFALVADLTAAIAEAEQAATAAGHQLKRDARHAKRAYFTSILEGTDPQGVWDLVQWTKPRRLDATATILKSDGLPAQTIDDLRSTFQEQFTPAAPPPVDLSILQELRQLPERPFPPFSRAEFQDCLRDTSNTSAPGPDHLTWFWLKKLVQRHPDAIEALLALYNACVSLGVHPTIFKWSVTVVIPKPNKSDYSKAKAYRPIVLLNCMGKLLEKLIARRMQFDGQKYGILHPCQFGGTIQHSTHDAGVQFVHNVRQAWRQGLSTSALLLDVSQFFPSINHAAMLGILKAQGFHSSLCAYFTDYLVGRTTQFRYNGRLMDPTDFTVGVGQGSALSPVLSGLYLAPVLHLSAPVQHAAMANASLQFFVDDGMISVAAPLQSAHTSVFEQLQLNNAVLAHLYHDLTARMLRLGLRVEADKLELMHFVRHAPTTSTFPAGQPLGPDLALRLPDALTRVTPKSTMRYLGFILDPRLTFREHIRQCVNKASSATHALRMLGNSARGLKAADRRRLYISNILPVALYGAQLWWHPGWHKTQWIAQELRKVQNRAGRWITGCFRTTPGGTLDLLAHLVPIRPQVNNYMHRAALRMRTLHDGHPLRASLSEYWTTNALNIVAPFPLGVASPLHPHDSPLHHADWIARQSNEDFAPLHDECAPGQRLLDTHHDRITFVMDAPAKKSKEFKQWKNSIFLPNLRRCLADPSARVLFTDGSHVDDHDGHRTGAAWAFFSPRAPTVHGHFGCGRATPYDAEMAALARGIKRAVASCTLDVRSLHLYVDNKAAANAILRCQPGPSQLMSIMACQHVRSFFRANALRTVTVHWCPAHVDVGPNELVDRLAKEALLMPQPDFVSFSTARQRAAAAATKAWRLAARSERYRGHHSLFRYDFDLYCTTKPTKHPLISGHGLPPHMFARWCRVMAGHYPHGHYRQRFNLEGPTACHCGHPLETTTHTLYDCPLWTRSKHFRRPDVPRHPPNPRDPFDDRDPENYDHRIFDPDYIPPEHQPTPADILAFLQLNPLVGTFEWCELLARARDDHDAGRHSSLAETEVWMHTYGKQRAIHELDDPDIWYDVGALQLFTDGWQPAAAAADFCDTPHIAVCPWTETYHERGPGYEDGRRRQEGHEPGDSEDSGAAGEQREERRHTPQASPEGVDEWVDRIMRERFLDVGMDGVRE